MDELWDPKLELFSDIYVYDSRVKDKIQRLLESPECSELVDKARSMGCTLPLLDELLPDKKSPAIPKLLSMLYPFDNGKEYKTKEDYLQYLKQAYGFMMTPLEVPPGRIISIFFPNYLRTWEPSSESAVELLKKFYVEVSLINELSSSSWKRISSAANPEAAIAKQLYGAKFKPDFEDFLRKIPWIISPDVYGSPGLDIIYRRAPGHELPKKPFGVGSGFLDNLVKASLENQCHILLDVGSERTKLKDRRQITEKIESEGSATIDSFIGISKIERDFVIHQRIIIWKNPGLEKYKKASLLSRIKYAKPSSFLCVIREQALSLEIPYLERKHEKIKKNMKP
jgi:hypothetical protein